MRGEVGHIIGKGRKRKGKGVLGERKRRERKGREGRRRS